MFSNMEAIMFEPEILYENAKTFGNVIRTIPNPTKDEKLLEALCKSVNATFTKIGTMVADMYSSIDLATSAEEQQRYVSLMEDAFVSILPSTGSFDLFSNVSDHFNRKIGRYILKGWDPQSLYIIDIFATLDVRIELSKPKRFVYKLFKPSLWSSKFVKHVVPWIEYRVRLWNTPASYYNVKMFEHPLKNLSYSSELDKVRERMGIPKSYNLEDKNYERIDFDIRRAIFNELYDVVQKGTDRKGILSSRGNDSVCK